MRAVRSSLSSFVLMLVLACLGQAQQRTFVSGTGSDANLCNRTGPCRTIAQAISITNPGGEVIVLDSAGYGPFTVSKSLSISAPPGVYAGISVASGDGITISAGSSDTVILRGLTINNQGSMGNGIFATGGNLQVERCVVNGFNAGQGVFFFEASASLEVKDSILRGSGCGIAVKSTGSGLATASIDRVRLEGNGSGLCANDSSQVTVRNSLASGNSSGFFASSSSSPNTSLFLENCVASGNTMDGVVVFTTMTGTATIKISNSTVTNNSVGLSVNGSNAMLLSRGNNTVEGNTTNTMGTIGSYGAK